MLRIKEVVDHVGHSQQLLPWKLLWDNQVLKMLNCLNKNQQIVQQRKNLKAKDVTEVKCMMVLNMLQNMVLLSDQNIHMLLLIKNVSPIKLRQDINLVVILMLNHLMQELMLKQQLIMHYQLLSMEELSISKSTEMVSTMLNVMEAKMLLIMESPILVMHQTII